jgi:hypothetical protein
MCPTNMLPFPQTGQDSQLRLGGKLVIDLQNAPAYNQDGILNFLHKVKKTRHRDTKTVAVGIIEFITTANNEMTKTLAMGPQTSNAKDRFQAIHRASTLQESGPKSLRDVPSIPEEGSRLRGVGQRLEGFPFSRILTIENVQLPMTTIYDFLGWLLSKLFSENIPDSERTAEDLYLPLLAMYSRWCAVIANVVKFKSLPMVHIAWWGNKTLLGATVGTVVGGTRDEVYMGPRRWMLNKAGYSLPKAKSKGGSNYGSCAQTFFFIVARHRQ